MTKNICLVLLLLFGAIGLSADGAGTGPLLSAYGQQIYLSSTSSAPATPPLFSGVAPGYVYGGYLTFTTGATTVAPIWTRYIGYGNYQLTASMSAPGVGTLVFLTPSAKTKLVLINPAGNTQTVYFRRTLTSSVPADTNVNYEELATGSRLTIDDVGATYLFLWNASTTANASPIRTVYQCDAINWTGTSY